MEKEILEFIRRRFSERERWIEGNCYYFAVILQERFKHTYMGFIWYDVVWGHFVYGNMDEGFYDQRGRYEREGMKMELWNDMKYVDESRRKRIYKGCIE